MKHLSVSLLLAVLLFSCSKTNQKKDPNTGNPVQLNRFSFTVTGLTDQPYSASAYSGPDASGNEYSWNGGTNVSAHPICFTHTNSGYYTIVLQDFDNYFQLGVKQIVSGTTTNNQAGSSMVPNVCIIPGISASFSDVTFTLTITRQTEHDIDGTFTGTANGGNITFSGSFTNAELNY